jgi:serine/threonine-protein kinase 24/25/MST4
MAKKTSYLSELIERHERWKAEGGERAEEETQGRLEDLSVDLFLQYLPAYGLQIHCH